MSEYLLTESTVRKLADIVRRHEQEIRLLKSQRIGAENANAWPREIYWGKTTQLDAEGYPDPCSDASGPHGELRPNTYWVALSDRPFKPADYESRPNTYSDTDTTRFIRAHSINGAPIPENTPVVVERQWSYSPAGETYDEDDASNDGQWLYWIRPRYVSRYRATANEDIAIDDYGQVTVAASAVTGCSAMTVYAYHDWKTTGSAGIASGQELDIEWDEGDSLWHIADWDCV